MMQYTNRFFAAHNSSRNEVVLTFMQEHPKTVIDLQPNNKQVTPVQEICTDEISTVVMSKECAANLIELLQRLISPGQN